MKVESYRTFSPCFEIDISFRSSLLRFSTLLVLMLFCALNIVFGQETTDKKTTDKKTKVEGKAKLEEILKEEDKKEENKLEKTDKKNPSGKMTNERLQELLTAETKKVEGQLGNWRADYNGLPLFIITDENANRMRIISPIIEEKKLTAADLKTLLEANFDKALDAKYSIYQKLLWSTYAHPLGELTDDQFKDALKQVFNLVRTYGTSYSSTGVVFGAQEQPEKEEFN